MNVPLLDLSAQYRDIKDEILKVIEGICEEQRFILGERVKAFEDEIAGYIGAAHAIGVASGSDALLLSLMALGVKEGDEIITTPYTFFATAGSISRLGAKPVFVDIDPSTYNINPKLIEEKITDKTKVIIPVHLYGQSAEMNAILKTAGDREIKVIEDAAQAIGAEYRGKRVGRFGDMGCFSFFPSKNLGGFGDGGMVVTDNLDLAERIRRLRVHGSRDKYYYREIGCNSRLDAIQASILSVKIRHLDKWSRERNRNAERYCKYFSDKKMKENISLPFVTKNGRHVYNQYVIRAKKRDELKLYLKEKSIGTDIYYPLPLHLQECYKGLGYKMGDFPEAESAAENTLALPIYPELTEKQQEYVVDMIDKFYNLTL
ncbi:MAG: DegT/DnrJ/EryC1/StrS family aminotransferase [Nitrospirota bacterium]